MSDLSNHLIAAIEIVKTARTKIRTTLADRGGGGGFPGAVYGKDGTAGKPIFQSDLDDSFENFTVPMPDSDQDRTFMGRVNQAGGFVLGHNVTAREAELYTTLDSDDKETLRNINAEARATAREEFPITVTQGGEPTLEDGVGDAFRHAYASALMARDLDPEFTKEITDAHEALPGGNDKGKAFMDLHNNQKGIEIALANPDSTNAELAELIKDEIKKGDMVILEDGAPVFSSNFYGEFGGTPTTLPEETTPPPVETEHKSSADEREEEENRRGTMDVSSPGGTPGGLGQVHG